MPAEAIHRMIAALPDGYRTVFELYCFEELSHKEIADLLGIKEKSSSGSLNVLGIFKDSFILGFS